VAQFEQPIRQTDLVQEFERRGMHGIAAEIAVEILVRFEQRHRHALARQQQREHRAARPGAHHATRSLLDIQNRVARQSAAEGADEDVMTLA